VGGTILDHARHAGDLTLRRWGQETLGAALGQGSLSQTIMDGSAGHGRACRRVKGPAAVGIPSLNNRGRRNVSRRNGMSKVGADDFRAVAVVGQLVTV
jgi:hypothetical protein